MEPKLHGHIYDENLVVDDNLTEEFDLELKGQYLEGGLDGYYQFGAVFEAGRYLEVRISVRDLRELGQRLGWS